MIVQSTNNIRDSSNLSYATQTYKTNNMAKDLFIDVETFSSVDIKTSGAYKYIESDDFEVLIVGYSIDDGPVKVVDLAMGEELPE